MNRISLIFALILLSYTAAAQSDPISGSWWGTIDLGSQKLSLAFEIIVGEDGSLKATMDVPQQSASGIPVELKRVTSDSLEISIPAISARYSGGLNPQNIISGTFTQNGLSLPLDLQRGKIKPNRPQTPQSPYPYSTEEVTFTNNEDGAVLSGTLTYPMMHFRYPAKTIPIVIMVTGSGAQNRDEEIYEHKPFAVIAHHLALNGIASLRYDDRGVGKSTGSLEGATSSTYKADADAAVAFLRSLDKFGKIGVLGHSEGGTIAFMMGAGQTVDFIISMAGTAAKGIDVLLGQNAAVLKLSGISEAVADQYCTALRIIFTDRISGMNVEDPQKYVADICSANSLSLPQTLQANLTQVITSGGDWMTWFLAHDPVQDISRISCPVFALNGNMDLQVISRDNLPVLRENLPENPRHLIKEYDSLNHLFQHCTYQTSMNYYAIEETVSEEVLKDIAAWINGLK